MTKDAVAYASCSYLRIKGTLFNNGNAQHESLSAEQVPNSLFRQMIRVQVRG